MKNVTSIFTHVTSPYLPKRGDCIQPPLTYYIPETTGINNYSYYKNLSELNQYTEHLSRIRRPFLHSFQSPFRFCYPRNQFFHRTIPFFHIINNRTEICRQRISGTTDIQFFLNEIFRLERLLHSWHNRCKPHVL